MLADQQCLLQRHPMVYPSQSPLSKPSLRQTLAQFLSDVHGPLKPILGNLQIFASTPFSSSASKAHMIKLELTITETCVFFIYDLREARRRSAKRSATMVAFLISMGIRVKLSVPESYGGCMHLIDHGGVSEQGSPWRQSLRPFTRRDLHACMQLVTINGHLGRACRGLGYNRTTGVSDDPTNMSELGDLICVVYDSAALKMVACGFLELTNQTRKEVRCFGVKKGEETRLKGIESEWGGKLGEDGYRDKGMEKGGTCELEEAAIIHGFRRHGEVGLVGRFWLPLSGQKAKPHRRGPIAELLPELPTVNCYSPAFLYLDY
ncbi:hypothetical protein B296_00005050 [Ensete ventricosum]|uniref:Uncharacterized protein n=1 Tax=Ensete ventricosum TaxID=4639 RepID=A0A427B821_ENSVE|nr:hypothetical protein B296_00005050 [Ensete ventricosum]